MTARLVHANGRDLDVDAVTWHLNVTTYRGVAIGATHWYGRIYQPDDRTSVTYPLSDEERDRYDNVDVVRPITPEVAAELSTPDFTYRPGGHTPRFPTRQAVIDAVIDQWRELPARRGDLHARLVLGHPAHIENQPILDTLGDP